MNELQRIEVLKSSLRATRDQLQEAIRDRNAAWISLARIATAQRLNANELRRFARRSCPGDPWNTLIELETGR